MCVTGRFRPFESTGHEKKSVNDETNIVSSKLLERVIKTALFLALFLFNN
jgi:hypothetical protein